MRASLFGLGVRSGFPQVTSAAMVNLYLEQRPAGEKSQIVALSTPGLRQFADVVLPVRGWVSYERDNIVFLVAGQTLYSIDAAGTLLALGALDTSEGDVGMEHNGSVVGIVDGLKFYAYDIATATLDDSVADSPANAQTIAYQDGYFIVSVAGSQRFYVGVGTSWQPADYAAAESNPDDIVAVYADQSEVVLFGSSSTEFWQNSGAADFPYARIPGSANEWGLAARSSIAKFDNTIMYLARNRSGEVMVARLNGYLPAKVSTHDIDRIINRVPTSDAVAYSYMINGHSMYVLTLPAGGITLMFDGASGLWSQLRSYGIDRHRSLRGLNAFGGMLVSDFENGLIYQVRADEHTDNGATIVRELVSEHLASQDMERVTVDVLRIDAEVGTGLPSGQGSDPQLMLQVSRDGGRTWGSERWQSMGRQGEYRRRVEYRRLGDARQFTFRLRFSDPVPLTLIAASVNPRD